MVVMVMELATFWGLSIHQRTQHQQGAWFTIMSEKMQILREKDKGSDYGTDNILEAFVLSGLM